MIKTAFCLVLVAVTVAANPVAAFDMGAGQVVGLLMQACVPQYGDILAVRKWLDQRKVPRVPEEGAHRFLQGAAGIVYDASNSFGRYGVTTRDNGICDVFAEKAKASDVIELLETSLKSKGLTVIRLTDYLEAKDARLHHFDYLIVRDGVNYDLVASLSDAPQVIQAQIGFFRRGPNEPLPSPLPPPR